MTNTPRYRVETNTVGSMAWRSNSKGPVKGYGRPTKVNLAAWVEGFNKSLEPGQPNGHLGKGHQITAAKLVDQYSGKVIATYGEWSD
jgi:hypothetical protein